MQRLSSYIPLLTLLWINPATADELDSRTAACIIEPSETCVVALFQETAEAAKTPKQRTHVFSALADAYERNARSDDAAPYWDMALSAALSAPDQKTKDETLSHYVSWSGRRHDIADVITTAEQISHDEKRDSALLNLAEGLTNEAHFDQARTVLLRRMDFGPLAVGLGDLASAQARAGNVEDAWRSFRTYEKAVAWVREDLISLDGDPHSVPRPESILTEIAVAVARAGLRKEAFETLTKIDNQHQILIAKARIAAAQAEAGDLSGARRTISGMKLRSDKTDSNLFSELLKDRLPRERDNARAGVAEALASRGELQRAASIASKIKDDERHDEAITEIAYSYVTSGEFEKLPWILTQKRTPMTLEAENPRIMAIYHANSGNPVKAREHFDRIPVEVWPVPVFISVAIRWSNIATLRHQYGDREGAARVLAKTLAYGKEENKGRHYGFVASIVVLHQSKQERFSEAVSTAVSIEIGALEDRATALHHILTELLAKQVR